MKKQLALLSILLSLGLTSAPIKADGITATMLWPEMFPQASLGWYRDSLDPVMDVPLKLCALKTDDTEKERLLIGYANRLTSKGYAGRPAAEPVTSLETLYEPLFRSARHGHAETLEEFESLYRRVLRPIGPFLSWEGTRGRTSPEGHGPQPSVFERCDVFIGSESDVTAVRDIVHESFLVFIDDPNAPRFTPVTDQIWPLGELVSNNEALQLHQFETFSGDQRTEVLDSWAKVTQGLEDYATFQFRESLDANNDQLFELAAHGVSNPAERDALLQRMKGVNYPGGQSLGNMLAFVRDVSAAGSDETARNRRVARDQQITEAAAEKEARRQAEAEAERQRRAEAAARRQAVREAREAELRKTHPYVARLSCSPSGMTDHLRLDACFIPSHGSNHSRLRLTNDGRMEIFESMEVYAAGTRRNDGLHIDLTPNFHIQAQNVASSLSLGIEITDRRTGEVVYVNRVGQFGVINISN
ncbi:hypothetical protein [Natronospira bacteriovora]|uniref:Uncharacterized protein n=1 Tax=Natronospira bacteriovora TaxID=3069753 RepID=A0ABU0W9X8_9GAMM|nr:hypothetical protein [Natronospira sp. AB-CW4]MDQ2070833.1 hypothetical protein [Natronospira sp. AB-CW4]